MELIQSPFMDIVKDLAKNAPYLTDKAQDAIAEYIMQQSKPVIMLKKGHKLV